MITYNLNGTNYQYKGDPNILLLDYLREELKVLSTKDGCSGEGICGTCTVQVDQKAKFACRTKMKSLEGKDIQTTEGMSQAFRQALGQAFVDHGGVQCGFCTPGFVMRAKALYDKDPMAGRHAIIKAITPNLCRCTGYVKIIDAIESAFDTLNGISKERPPCSAGVGKSFPKYQALQTTLGEREFVDDMQVEGMIHAALRFSDHPRAQIIRINTDEAKKIKGVHQVFTANDIPGEQLMGLITRDWPLMVGEGQITHYIGDVLAIVVADTATIAREAARLISVEYEILKPITDIHEAIKKESGQVHQGQSNIIDNCVIRFGDLEQAFKKAAFCTEGEYQTQRIEHAFLEPEACLALPEEKGVRVYSQGQGVYEDQKQIADLLGLPKDHVCIVQIQNGGAFGGKEDLSIQGHAALSAFLLQKPVSIALRRDESIRMHPKRHPVWMHMKLACDEKGKFTAMQLKAIGDTGAYASVGTKVMERVVGHATGGYTVPAVDIESLTVYTNNIPCGAMRGFGVPQVVFALESCIDELCRMGDFDRWKLRYENALEDGSTTATGQKLLGVGLKETLLAVKEPFYKAKYAGLACAMKNTGIGNGMVDDSEVGIEIVSDKKVNIHHGWTEMGQGVHTMAIQVLHQETGIPPEIMEVKVETKANLPTGMTTASRATALVGNALIEASKNLKKDLQHHSLGELAGKTYKGIYRCDWTSKPGEDQEDPRIHFAYGYATQLVTLDDKGKIEKVIAAHDAGKIMNPMLFEGQIEGSVHMGLGYALSEDLPMTDGVPHSLKLKDVGMLRAREMPEIEVIGIEVADPYGPYGAKGVGEIGMVPTAAAAANAFTAYDGIRRFELPLQRKKSK
jgi:selenium-dependent xanthine dehydrogenase